MKRETRKYAVPGACFLAAFVLWTVLLCFADHQAIGPQGSAVGFAGLNGYVHRLTGVHWITDIIGGMLLSAGFVFLYRAICRTI